MERIEPEANADETNQSHISDGNAMNESSATSFDKRTDRTKPADGHRSAGELINESDTESESRLFIQSETEMNERDTTDDDVPAERSAKANGGATSSGKQKNAIDNDSEIDDGDFAGFSESELNDDRSEWKLVEN